MLNKFHKIKKIASGRNLTKVKEGWVFKDGIFQKVWSGASEVSYYDGDTLLGTEEVDEGEDVLHPSINTTKSGYTLYGWATTKGSETRVTSLLATGEPMTVYAVYLPNTLTVFSGDRVNGSYSVYSKNDKYVSGGFIASATRATYYVGGGSADASASFSINLGVYQQANVSGRGTVGGYGDTYNEHSYYDGSEYTETYFSRTHTASGAHSLSAHGDSSGNQSYLDVAIWIRSITLSNPIAWV